MYQFNMLDKTK